MKRGKEDERMMGPMFPRLHVNDTEKGGPRAPPRNKMALYEQLSIPSQRFNSGLLPHNPNNNSTVVPPASSTQGSDNKRTMFFPVHLPLSTHLAEKSNASSSDFNASLIAPKKKVDEEDFMVPIFVQSEKGQNLSKNSDSLNREKLPLSSPVHVSNSVRNQSSCGEEQKQASTKFFKLRQSDRSQNEENSKEFVGSREQSVKYAQGVLAIEKTRGSLKQTDASKNQEDRDHFMNDLDGIRSSYALHHEVINSSQSQIGGTGHSSIPSFSFPEEQGNLNDSTLGGGYSLGIRNGDGCDNDSDTSMVDSVSGVDISPDDVVGIIGQKHFWKARRAIVNQQRVFAVQVFELHRLIKVQRLFAGSPHLLLEDVAYLGKPLKASPTKELSLEFILKPNLNTVKRKDDNKNPCDKMEGSAENAVGETPLSVQNVSQISNQRPFSANPVSTPVSSDTKLNPWDFPQPSGHQWLMPVLSPTEGLIYKPYSGHTGSNPMMGNFINSPHGIQNSHPYYQGFGVPPCFPLVHHGYFPPYGMPVAGPAISGSAIDQGNYFAGQGLHGCLGPLSGPGACSTKQHQNSCNASTQKKNETSVPNVIKMKIGKESELQMSTASSPGEGRNGLPLFPTSPAVDVNSGNRGRVIKVVPHNAMSTNESAFRIFQSIQEERKQYDSV